MINETLQQRLHIPSGRCDVERIANMTWGLCRIEFDRLSTRRWRLGQLKGIGSEANNKKQVNVPKTRRTYCKGKDCRKHTQHKVTQYKAGKVYFKRCPHRRNEVLTIWDRHLFSRKESVVMIASSPVTVVRQSLCSTRRQRRRRRLC